MAKNLIDKLVYYISHDPDLAYEYFEDPEAFNFKLNDLTESDWIRILNADYSLIDYYSDASDNLQEICLVNQGRYDELELENFVKSMMKLNNPSKKVIEFVLDFFMDNLTKSFRKKLTTKDFENAARRKNIKDIIE
jgi:hypothetical protein